jgi:MoaA/NifB/PqqE/SkfB family radical SAM enzyme
MTIAHLMQLYNFLGKYEFTRKKASWALKSIPEMEVFFKNKILNELEIAQKKTILSSKIRRLSVTLSNKCNLSCIMCITHNVRWEIPRKTIEEIYSLFPYLEKVMWQGGEVFVLDYFEDMFTYALGFPNLKQSIVTNGQLITEQLAEKLVKNNVELTFSVDGITKDVYEYIRRGANFETLIRNINLISELKKQYNSNIILNLNVAIMKSNCRQLERFIEFAKTHGFEFVCFMPIHIHLKTAEDIFTNQDMEALTFITEISPKIEAMAKEFGIRIENRLPRLVKESIKMNIKIDTNKSINQKNSAKLLCHIPWQQLLIDYDGTVRPDCLCKIEKSAGDLLKNDSLEEIWNNKIIQDYRKKLINHDYKDLCNHDCTSGKIAQSHLKFP